MSSRVVQRLLGPLQAVQLLNVHLLLLDLCAFLNLLAVKHIFISIWRLSKTSITIFASLLLFHAIASHREALILLILQRISLLTTLHCIHRLLAAQMLLISRLAPHSVGTLRLRSIHKSKLA
jgi:hypothetical protein